MSENPNSIVFLEKKPGEPQLVSYGLTCIIGATGTGKTYCMNKIIDNYITLGEKNIYNIKDPY